MKSLILSHLLISFFSIAYTQSLELGGGLLINNYYVPHQEDGHDRSYVSGSEGYSIFIAVDDLFKEFYRLRLEARLENYGGSISTYSGGLGSGGGINGSLERTNLHLTFYPLNIVIKEHFRINLLGLDFGFLIKERSDIVGSSWSISNPSFSSQDTSSDFITKQTFGFLNRIAIQGALGNNFYLVPQYRFYIGMTDEVLNDSHNILSTRHHFLLSLLKVF